MDHDLPSTLSAILELAVNDCMALESDDGFELNESVWYYNSGDVIMIGMVGTLMRRAWPSHLSKNAVAISPDDFDGRTKQLLTALNCMRVGLFKSAANALELGSMVDEKYDTLTKCRNAVLSGFDYKLDRADWPTYLWCAKELRSVDL